MSGPWAQAGVKGLVLRVAVVLCNPKDLEVFIHPYQGPRCGGLMHVTEGGLRQGDEGVGRGGRQGRGATGPHHGEVPGEGTESEDAEFRRWTENAGVGGNRQELRWSQVSGRAAWRVVGPAIARAGGEDVLPGKGQGQGQGPVQLLISDLVLVRLFNSM